MTSYYYCLFRVEKISGIVGFPLFGVFITLDQAKFAAYELVISDAYKLNVIHSIPKTIEQWMQSVHFGTRNVVKCENIDCKYIIEVVSSNKITIV